MYFQLENNITLWCLIQLHSSQLSSVLLDSILDFVLSCFRCSASETERDGSAAGFSLGTGGFDGADVVVGVVGGQLASVLTPQHQSCELRKLPSMLIPVGSVGGGMRHCPVPNSVRGN